MRLGDDQWKRVDADTWRLSIQDLYEVDRFQAFGPGDVKVHLDLQTTYARKPGSPTVITPQTTDPLSPFNWAGVVWGASAKGTFSARYDDGSWSVTGTFDDARATEGTPGHLIHERNGVFATESTR